MLRVVASLRPKLKPGDIVVMDLSDVLRLAAKAGTRGGYRCLRENAGGPFAAAFLI